MLNGKKGVSTVVVTILFVLIGIVAVMVVWMAIRGYITKGTGESERLQQCMNLNLEIQSAKNINNDTEVEIIVNRGIGSGDIAYLDFYLDNSLVDAADVSDTNAPIEGATASYIIDVTDIDMPDKVSIQPVIGEDTKCPAVSSDVKVE